MIAVIHVALTRGLIMSREQLRDVITAIFQHEVPPTHRQRAEGKQRYIADILGAQVYTCIPLPNSEASFLWLTEREFEIVIETFHQGHLLRSVKSILRTLDPRLKQFDFKAEYYISTLTGDAQTYISGQASSLASRIIDGLKDNFVGLIVAIFLLILAAIWLDQYYQEAVAVVISFALFSIGETLYICLKARTKKIQWTVHEED